MEKNVIEEAKKLAKEDYENYMKKIKCFNPKYKRKWVRYTSKSGYCCYALEGTPDKAFVMVYPKEKIVEAVRQDGTVIKKFQL